MLYRDHISRKRETYLKRKQINIKKNRMAIYFRIFIYDEAYDTTATVISQKSISRSSSDCLFSSSSYYRPWELRHDISEFPLCNRSQSPGRTYEVILACALRDFVSLKCINICVTFKIYTKVFSRALFMRGIQIFLSQTRSVTAVIINRKHTGVRYRSAWPV